MAVASTEIPKGKLVIRNIGLLLSGNLQTPILAADTIVTVDGIITAVGKQQDCDIDAADRLIDAKGTTVSPGLIDSHVGRRAKARSAGSTAFCMAGSRP